MQSLLVLSLWWCCADVPGAAPLPSAKAPVVSSTKPAMPVSIPATAPVKGVGFVYQPAFALDEDVVKGAPRPYRPQAGDLFMSTDNMRIIQWGHKWAGANAPHHSGIVLCKKDGSYWTLEAGPHNSLRIRALDLEFSLSSYESKGCQVWVRCRKTPLTAEQCDKLNEFGLAQDGKAFALGRMLAQLTPLSSRSLLGSAPVGGPHGHRNSYFCAELVTECCVAAGLLDAKRSHPCCTYPSDLFFGRSSNRIVDETLDINLHWEAPSRWTHQPVVSGK